MEAFLGPELKVQVTVGAALKSLVEVIEVKDHQFGSEVEGLGIRNESLLREQSPVH